MAEIQTHRMLESFTRRKQISLLRLLAETALADYDLPPVRLTLIAHLFNTTFRAETAGGQRYMLRVHRAGAPTIETVSSELAWLAALRNETPMEVPGPVPTRSGSLLTVVPPPAAAPEIQPHICVLFRWLPGRRLKRALGPEHLERVGALMGHLQNHAARWQPPAGFRRGRIDTPIEAAKQLADPFSAEVAASIYRLVANTLSRSEAVLVMEVLERVRAAEEALQQDPAAFGLIHADLHYGNLLFERDTVRAIDFDDCGFGPYLYDPAVMLSAVLGWTQYPALRAALMAGYRRVRPLPTRQEAYLDTFIALRQVQDALWVLEWRKHPALGDDWVGTSRRSLAPVRALLGYSD